MILSDKIAIVAALIAFSGITVKGSIIYIRTNKERTKEILKNRYIRILAAVFILSVIAAFIPWEKFHYGDEKPRLEQTKSPQVGVKQNTEIAQNKKITSKIDSPKIISRKAILRHKISKSILNPSSQGSTDTTKKAAATISNSGNLSMYQSGGTVNQFTVPELPDRSLNESDKETIRSLIKSGYTIDMTIVTSGSEETQTYGMQLLGYLQHTYIVSNSTLTELSSENKKRGRKRFYYQIDDDKKIVYIFVQTQQ